MSSTGRCWSSTGVCNKRMPEIIPLVLSAILSIIGDTSMENFASHATCGVVAEVESVEEIGDVLERYQLEERYELFVIKATFRVIETLEGSVCPPMPPRLEVLFSDEVHSSHPSEQQTVALFPRKHRDVWLEAAYGRSYWHLIDREKVWMVHVDWRNDFLLGELDLQERETAEVPLSAVARALKKARSSMPEHR